RSGRDHRKRQELERARYIEPLQGDHPVECEAVGRRKNFGEEQHALFELGAAAAAAPAADVVRFDAAIDRSAEIPGVLLGTSSVTARGVQGKFYPAGMKGPEFLTYYEGRFRAVEIDSTFYGTPRASTVLAWKDKTPADFLFALKIPQVVTHEKILV